MEEEIKITTGLNPSNTYTFAIQSEILLTDSLNIGVKDWFGEKSFTSITVITLKA